MAKHEQVCDKRGRSLTEFSGPGSESSRQIGDAKSVRQFIQPRQTARLGLGNFFSIHHPKGVGADQAGVAFDEIKTERQGQDRDHDHEPVAMFAKNFDHGWAGNLRIRGHTPSGFVGNAESPPSPPFPQFFSDAMKGVAPFRPSVESIATLCAGALRS